MVVQLARLPFRFFQIFFLNLGFKYVALQFYVKGLFCSGMLSFHKKHVERHINFILSFDNSFRQCCGQKHASSRSVYIFLIFKCTKWLHIPLNYAKKIKQLDIVIIGTCIYKYYLSPCST